MSGSRSLIAFLREYRQAGDRDRLAGMAWATRFLAGHSLAAIGYRLWYGVIRPRPDPE